ncbi:disintegrin and metalloproteinase domain-containing protein 8 isoform X7 [Bubalus bubalis]|uniref:disintegrin and metalloproteinase domain-containing protein 8 isoform X7 n=1 Tax=Bubalus bubalis TaxID=89462 RepID=UPI001E1B7BEB|nr:disintegrin and metalloproteinase domain-containing protein 8 isoform X7 [Bubalus bubalis]
MRGLGLLLFAALGLQEVAPGAALPHMEQYEVVRPRRLPAPRARRALPSHLGLYPESVSYVLGARGHTFTLHLRKNRDLVGSGYAETYTAANGSQVTEQLRRQDHCFYQGHVEGHPHSAASLSTCAGLRGFFQAGPAVRLIEPLAGTGEEGPHALYLAQHLQQEAGTCGVNDSSLESILGPRVSAALRPRWSEPRETRYVELFVVTDSKEFQRFGSREAVRQRVLEVVNHVDKLYQELNFRVVLVGLEMWNGGDKIQVSSQPEATLDNFLAWRTRELVGRQAHDNVQLITGVDFTGTTVGLAKVSSMCSQSSGAVNQDHSQNPIGVASTMAHEMGHNLGMDHDENVAGCYCPVPRDGGGCVMAASIGSQYPRKFSQCSRADLETFVEKPRTACLVDAPDLDRLVGGPVCGNGFLERGEQCDCGQPEDCQNPCCNASACLLAEGAECAHGTCCHECRVKPAGEPCRPAKDQCDLGEHCDGQQPTCPEDTFRENGTPCPGGYCYNGACPTLARRCQHLWGPGSRVAVETCFLYSISKGCRAGVPLPSSRVDKCGTLFCEGGQKTPEHGYCTLTISSGVCQAVVQDGSTAFAGTASAGTSMCTDPGTAPPGATATGNVAPKTAMGLSNPLFHEGLSKPAKGGAQAPPGGSPEPTPYSQPPKPTASSVTPKRPPPAVSASHPDRLQATPRSQPPGSLQPPATKASPPSPLPVYPPQALGQQLRPTPPAKPLPVLKPKQVIKPTCAPPMPPVKPGARGAQPGPTQGAADPKVALKSPVQRR